MQSAEQQKRDSLRQQQPERKELLGSRGSSVEATGKELEKGGRSPRRIGRHAGKALPRSQHTLGRTCVGTGVSTCSLQSANTQLSSLQHILASLHPHPRLRILVVGPASHSYLHQRPPASHRLRKGHPCPRENSCLSVSALSPLSVRISHTTMLRRAGLTRIKTATDNGREADRSL